MSVALPKVRMTVDEYLAWGEAQPEGRYELVEGNVVAMSPERVRHNRVKGSVFRALSAAVEAAALPCTVFTDGVGVRTGEHTIREPDASVQCGSTDNLDPNAMLIDAPVIVVEVSSPSSERDDSTVKLVEYFRVPSVRHYLLVRTDKGVVIHHFRSDDGDIRTRILHDGAIDLIPPGFSVAVERLLPPDMIEREARP